MEKAGDRAGAASLTQSAIADLEKTVSLDPGLRKRIAPTLEDARARLRSLRP